MRKTHKKECGRVRKKSYVILAIFAMFLLFVGCTKKDERYNQVTKVVYKTYTVWGDDMTSYHTWAFDFETETLTYEKRLISNNTLLETWKKPLTETQLENIQNALIKNDFFTLPDRYEVEAEDGDYQGMMVVAGGSAYKTGGFLPVHKQFNAIQQVLFEIMDEVDT